MEIASIAPKRLEELGELSELELCDVRTAAEFKAIRAEGARNVPLDALDPHRVMQQRKAEPNDTLYIICKSGARGAKACRMFHEAGYTNVINIEGGTLAWDAAGLPVLRDKTAISLDRQVRIAAGVIVFLGAALALAVHPWFAAIPAVVGAGLAVAGIMDSCLMGMCLAKMPWNQLPDTASPGVGSPNGRVT